MEKNFQSEPVHSSDSLIDLGAASAETKGADGLIVDGGSQGQKYDPTGLIED